MGLRRHVALGVDGDTACVDPALRRARVQPPLHVVDARGDVGPCEHLVVEESHVGVLMAAVRASASIHSLRVKHEVLRLGHHLIPSQQTLAHVVSAPVAALAHRLRARQVVHQLASRAGRLVSFEPTIAFLLIAHTGVGQPIRSLFRSDALQVVREGLSAVHLVVCALAEHHVRDAGLLLREAITLMASSLPCHVFAVCQGVAPEGLDLVRGTLVAVLPAR